MRADLHIHTTASDGTWDPAQVVQAVYDAGIEAFAISDHDSVANVAETKMLAQGAGLRFITGVELNSTKDGHNYHNELLKQAAAEWDAREEYRYLYPFRDGMDEVRLIEYERIARRRFPTWDAVLWKTLYLPPAVVLDTLLLPGYIAGSAYLYPLYLFVAYCPLGGIQ